MSDIYDGDRVQETSTTTGTGTLNLDGAVTYKQGFVAGIGTGKICFYAIVHRTASEWEIGYGTITDASPDTLSRTTIISSSNGGSAVNFSAGTKDVFATIPKNHLDYIGGSGIARGDILYRGANTWQRLAAGTATYKLTANGAAADPSWNADREVLTAARTYYVRTDGSDSNTGLVDSAGGAFLTIQKAINVASALDNGGYDITIDVGNGTYTGANTLKYFVGSGSIIIVGDESTPANVVISTTSGHCFQSGYTGGVYHLRGMTLQTTTSGYGIIAGSYAQVNFQNLDFGVIVNNHILVTTCATVIITGNYSISGGGSAHIQCATGGNIYYSGTPTLTVSASVSITTFANCLVLGSIDYRGVTITLGAFTVTGTRYSATQNAVIRSNGGGANYFPGTIAGSTATGGLYS